MIKIEQLKNGAKATIVRKEVRQPVYAGMIVTAKELETIQTTGPVVYTIDESEIVEIGVDSQVPVADTTETSKSDEPINLALETTVEVQETAKVEIKPAVIKPAPRSAKK